MTPLLLLVLLAAVTQSREAADTDSVDLLRVQRGDALADPLLFVVARATFGANLPRDDDDALLLRVVQGSVSDDCTRVTKSAASAAHGDDTLAIDSRSAVLVERGGRCSFVQKALAAQHAGASLIIIRDTIAGAVASQAATTYDCSLGSGAVSSNASFPLIDAQTLDQEAEQVSACTSAATCSSGACILTGQQQKASQRFDICCFQSQLVRMSVSADQQELANAVHIPAIFLCYADAETLKQLIRSSSVAVQALNVHESPWNVSMALSWLLGVCVVMGAAYHSCTHERVFSYQKVAHALTSSLHRSSRASSVEDGYVSIGDHGVDAEDTRAPPRDERMELTGRHTLLFLVGASCVLLLVYYVHLLLLISVLFAMGASIALAQVVLVPLTLTVLPASWTSGNRVLYISGALGIAIGSFWFVERSWSPIWPLQDVLCIALCFVFIDTIELPSLRVGAMLLGVAFVYDVFFVYLSPFVFGSNVMVAVASGAGNTQLGHQQPESHQSAPMVLSIPLLFSFYGGNALLGLGDLIIPGLLVAFCIRFDYCMGYPLSAKYFSVASVSYALGLLIANVMAIVLRDVVAGQPALMYIVPLMLVAVAGFARWNGELQEIWDGPVCLQMGLEDDSVATGRRGNGDEETRPLVTTNAT